MLDLGAASQTPAVCGKYSRGASSRNSPTTSSQRPSRSLLIAEKSTSDEDGGNGGGDEEAAEEDEEPDERKLRRPDCGVFRHDWSPRTDDPARETSQLRRAVSDRLLHAAVPRRQAARDTRFHRIQPGLPRERQSLEDRKAFLRKTSVSLSDWLPAYLVYGERLLFFQLPEEPASTVGERATASKRMFKTWQASSPACKAERKLQAARLYATLPADAHLRAFAHEQAHLRMRVQLCRTARAPLRFRGRRKPLWQRV